MPLIEELDRTLYINEWFHRVCKTDQMNDERQNEWNLRHSLLDQVSGQAWIGTESKNYDWSSADHLYAHPCALLSQDESLHSKSIFSNAIPNGSEMGTLATRVRATELRVEFEALRKKWQRDTKHLSLVAKKIIHPSYLRIIGMGEAAIPLLLEALRNKPDHWFVALSATTNTDPSGPNANPIQAREAWIEWGILKGYID